LIFHEHGDAEEEEENDDDNNNHYVTGDLVLENVQKIPDLV
jgi:hypothetical protein